MVSHGGISNLPIIAALLLETGNLTGLMVPPDIQGDLRLYPHKITGTKLGQHILGLL